MAALTPIPVGTPLPQGEGGRYGLHPGPYARFPPKGGGDMR